MFTAEEISANLARDAFEAKTDWHRAKQSVTFILTDELDRPYPGFYVREAGRHGPTIAVLPKVRDAIAARVRAMAPSGVVADIQVERIMSAPLRADGLVLLDEWLDTTIISDPKNRALVAEKHRKALDARRAAQAEIEIAAQQEKERAILDRLPTESVDRYIVEHMDCSPERFDGFGKATRRSWRKRARQEMTAAAKA